MSSITTKRLQEIAGLGTGVESEFTIAVSSYQANLLKKACLISAANCTTPEDKEELEAMADMLASLERGGVNDFNI